MIVKPSPLYCGIGKSQKTLAILNNMKVESERVIAGEESSASSAKDITRSKP